MGLDYEPLTGTRAGKYARLAKQGREEEALEREQRRVSSVAFSPKRYLQQQQSPEESEASVESLGDGNEEVVEEAAIEAHDGDAQEDQIHDDEMLNGFEDDERGGRESDHTGGDGEIEAAFLQSPSDVHQGRGRQSQHGEQRDTAESDNASRDVSRRTNGDLPLPKDQDQEQLSDEFAEEEVISDKSESHDRAGKQELVHAGDDAERWQEVAHLLLSASRQNLQSLRKHEEGFHPGLMMRWIGEQVALV
jgi:hypothetical protein